MYAVPTARTMPQTRCLCIFTVILPSIAWFLIVGIIAIALNPMYISYKRTAPDSNVLMSKTMTVALLVKENDVLHDRRKKGTIKDSREHVSGEINKTTHKIVSRKLVPFLTTMKINDTNIRSISLDSIRNSRQKHLIGPVIRNKISIIQRLIFQFRNVPILVNKVYKMAKQIQLMIIIYISPINPDLPVNSTRTTTIFTIPAIR